MRADAGPAGESSASPTACSDSSSPPDASRNKFHASRYRSYFGMVLHREIALLPRIAFSGTRYHVSSSIAYAARKSNDPASYLTLLVFRLQIYPFALPCFAIVHFTCTATNFPVLPTTQSNLAESPNGLLTVSPFSAARAANTASAHSPRFLLSLMISGFFLSTTRTPHHAPADQAIGLGDLHNTVIPTKRLDWDNPIARGRTLRFESLERTQRRKNRALTLP